jgi:hypothetical protein
MSKLAKCIDAKILFDEYRAAKLPTPKYFDVGIEAKEVVLDYKREVQVRIGTHFECRVWITDAELKQSDAAITSAKTRIKRAMIEEIFGEFRPLLHEIVVASYDGDMHKMRELIQNLEHQMFVEGCNDWY